MLKRLLFLVCTIAPAFAQTSPVTPSPAALEADLQQRLAAGRARAEIAESIRNRSASADEAFERVKVRGVALRAGKADHAETTAAALDVAQRLLILNEPEAALKFFHAAEAGYVLELKQTSEKEPQKQARLLQNLAWLRSTYLGKKAEAEANLRRAAALQPDNKRLQVAVKNLDDAAAVLAERKAGKFGGRTP